MTPLSSFSSSGTTPSAISKSSAATQFCDYFSLWSHSRSGSMSSQKAGQSSAPPSPSSSGSESSLPSSCPSRNSVRYSAEDDTSSNNDSGSDSTGGTSLSSSPSAAKGAVTDSAELPPADTKPSDLTGHSTRSPVSQHFEPSISGCPDMASSLRNTTGNELIASGKTTISTPIFPFSRPYSLPVAPRNSYLPDNLTNTMTTHPRSSTSYVSPSSNAPSTSKFGWSDRSSSSASLPLPTHTPYNVLTKASVPPASGTSDGAPDGTSGPADPSAGAAAGAAHAAKVRSAHETDMADPAGFLPRERRTQQRNHVHDGGALSSNSPDIRESVSSLPPFNRRSTPPCHTPSRPFTSPSGSVSRSHVSSQSTSESSPYPAPAPPMILAPTFFSPGPFLSRAPPPPDSWIEVETMRSEYKLTVRLPGFNRDGITLATKRMRILHVVADSWENSGGEFFFVLHSPDSSSILFSAYRPL